MLVRGGRLECEACGLPHRHPHRARRLADQAPLPLIPGHEGVGIVEALGPGAGDEISEGDRVAIPWLGFACGHCRYCNSGSETLCEAQISTGYGMDGGYAAYATAYARHVVKAPEGEDSRDAAPLSCAGVTVYKAVRSSEVGPSQLCAIFGVGGLKGSISRPTGTSRTFQAADARSHPVLHETRPLEEVNEAVDDVEHARNKAPRAVLTV